VLQRLGEQLGTEFRETNRVTMPRDHKM
jgi:hypothetical protein